MSLVKVMGLTLAIAAAAACAAGPSPMPAAPAARCEPGDSSLVREVLYFGRNRPSGGVVSDAEWQGFLDQVVTPRFPAGLTVVDATGQWRGKSGRVEREQAEILTIFHSGDLERSPRGGPSDRRVQAAVRAGSSPAGAGPQLHPLVRRAVSLARSPLTSHLSPLTSYLSPLTSHLL
jgi:hypothetical protein